MNQDGSVIFALRGQEIKTIAISDIHIERRQRTLDPNSKEFREWMAHIEKLASSIKRAGLIHPITLEDETNKLIAGFNRIQAFMKMGLKEIPYVRRSELSDIDRQVLELEDNVARLDLSMADRVKAIAKIDELQRLIAGDKGESWTTARTAEMVGISVGTVSQAKKIVEAAKVDPSVFDATGLVAALNKIKVGEQLDKRKADIARRESGLLKTYPAEILVGDAYELIQQEESESFDAVITNFPFGVELRLGKEQREIYKDDEDYVTKLVRNVAHETYRVLRPDSWFVGFFDVRKITWNNKQRAFVMKAIEMARHYAPTADWLPAFEELGRESLGLTYWLEEAGYNYVQLLPNIWTKPNKSQGKIGDPNKGLIMTYEAFVFAGKGNPVLFKKGRQNVFVYDTPLGLDRDIDVQMPLGICRELVSMTCLGGSRILDPFAGSGAVGDGALDEQCSFRGYELDPKRAEVGNLRLKEHLHAEGSTQGPLPGMKEFLANREFQLALENASKK